MDKSDIIIRNAVVSDAEQIAMVHIESWKSTYRGIISDDFLDSMDLQSRTERWNKILNESCENIFVAEYKGAILGFTSAGKSREENNYESELYAIYILKQHHQKKLGSLLMHATIKHLLTSGFQSIYVWVLLENNSKNFYERLGGKQFDMSEVEIGGKRYKMIAYGWNDLLKLIDDLNLMISG